MHSSMTYPEAASTANSPVTGINRSAFNDAPGTPPRAMVSANNAGFNGSDYLVVKSTVVAANATAKKWTYVNYSAGGGTIDRWNNAEDFVADERVIVVRSAFNSDTKLESRDLVGDGATTTGFYHTLTGAPPTTLPSAFSPTDPSDTYFLYGIGPKPAPSTDPNLRMPFNRADYYIDRPVDLNTFPKSCHPNTGVLYKGVCNHGDGSYTPLPLLDCVADMQVVYTLDMNEDGEAGTYANPAGESTGSEILNADTGTVPNTLLNAQLLRRRLKEIRVYILAQDGGRDRNFTYPSSTVTVGEFDMGRTFDLTGLGTNWQNYRWKVYTIVVEPKNLSR
jgi:hypothetical protein